jgi:hypothetical protein
MTETITFAELPLTIKAKVWDKQPLMLHTQLASGELKDKTPFKILQNISNHSIFVQIDNGQVYEVGLYALMDAILEARE